MLGDAKKCVYNVNNEAVENETIEHHAQCSLKLVVKLFSKYVTL